VNTETSTQAADFYVVDGRYSFSKRRCKKLSVFGANGLPNTNFDRLAVF
jgi:hypothetical protein